LKATQLKKPEQAGLCLSVTRLWGKNAEEWLQIALRRDVSSQTNKIEAGKLKRNPKCMASSANLKFIHK
jgi:hypothetical protein